MPKAPWLVGIDAVAASGDRHTLPWLKALANHGQLLLWAPGAPPLLAQKLPILIVAVSHKHNRLPTRSRGARPIHQGGNQADPQYAYQSHPGAADGAVHDLGWPPGIGDHRTGMGGRRLETGHSDFPPVQDAGGLPRHQNQALDAQSGLLEPAWDALRKLDAINQLKTVDTVDVVERDNKTVRKHKLHFVFLNTKSGLPHVSDFVVRDRSFKAHLKAAGVRYRGPGQCRHTYASQLLTTGVASVDWIAEQMGHTSANMIRQHYGMWINEDGPDVIGMLQHALGIQPPGGDKAQ